MNERKNELQEPRDRVPLDENGADADVPLEVVFLEQTGQLEPGNPDSASGERLSPKPSPEEKK